MSGESVHNFEHNVKSKLIATTTTTTTQQLYSKLLLFFSFFLLSCSQALNLTDNTRQKQRLQHILIEKKLEIIPSTAHETVYSSSSALSTIFYIITYNPL